MPFDIVLYEPEIPPNTGSIVRLAANTGAALHLIRPLGFDWDDRRLKRAGLDYHEYASVTLHDSLAAYRSARAPARIFGFTTRATRWYTDASYAAGDALLFGPESRGLPAELLTQLGDEAILRLPMQSNSRSLNLANAVSVAVYEAWRQLEFVGAR